MMLSTRAFGREGVAQHPKAPWSYRFVLESLGLGTSRRDLDADLRSPVDGYLLLGAGGSDIVWTAALSQ